MLFENSEDGSQRRPLIFFVLASLAVGTAATVFTEPSIPTWYAGLVKPGFNPPDWLFAPVWTALYILMAVAAWRVWRIAGLKSIELTAFFVQLALNCAWSFLFFSAHWIAVALADLGMLWLLILATLILFWRRDRLAGLLLLPYLAWAGFALALNAAIWQLNG